MEIYDSKSCSALEKPYYKPIEAALRWCNLIAHESHILQVTGEALFPPASAFPQWPCCGQMPKKSLMPFKIMSYLMAEMVEP